MSGHIIAKENRELKERLQKIKEELQEQIYSKNHNIKESIEETLKYWKERNNEVFGESNYFNAISELITISEETTADLLGERIKEEYVIKQKINVSAREQKILIRMEYCYDRIEKILGEGEVFNEKMITESVELEEEIEKIVNTIKEWVQSLREELLKLMKEKGIRELEIRTLNKDKKEEKRVWVLNCLECGEIVKVKDFIPEEVEGKIDEYLEYFEELMREHMSNLLKLIFKEGEEKYKDKLLCVEKGMSLKGIKIEMMKQYGMYDKDDNEEEIYKKINKGEKKDLEKYSWFKKELPLEVESDVKNLEKIIPEKSIYNMFKEIKDVLEFVKNNETDKDILDIIKDDGTVS